MSKLIMSALVGAEVGIFTYLIKEIVRLVYERLDTNKRKTS